MAPHSYMWHQMCGQVHTVVTLVLCKEPKYVLHRRQHKPQSHSRCDGEEKCPCQAVYGLRCPGSLSCQILMSQLLLWLTSLKFLTVISEYAFCSHSAVYAAPKSGQWAYCSRLVGPPFQPGAGSHWFYNSRVLSPANLERLDPGPLTRSTSCAPPSRHAGVSLIECASVVYINRGFLEQRMFICGSIRASSF